jgi:AbrB family looped-hinge helix DNA binding protein
MTTTTLSSKYQIVIPKAIRQKMNLKAGMPITLYSLDEGRAILVKQPKKIVKTLRGLGKEVWQSLGGADTYIKQERASWDK